MGISKIKKVRYYKIKIIQETVLSITIMLIKLMEVVGFLNFLCYITLL